MQIVKNVGRPVADRAAQWLLMSGISRMKAGKLKVEFPGGGVRQLDSSNPGPDAALTVLHPSFFRQVLLHGEIGFGEAYQQRLCDTPDLVALLSLAIENRRAVNLNRGPMKLLSRRRDRSLHKQRANTLEGSRHNIHDHYDLGNDFFKLWLDDTMTYSSAVFEKDGEPLIDAQRNKYRRMCELAQITAGGHVLEIGTGWGGFAIFAASTYGCHVTTITISQEQYALATQRIEEAGLAEQIDVKLMDYREVEGTYDAIVSIEMFEAVGAEFFQTFFEKCASVLKPGGRLAMQVITVPDSAFEAQKTGVNWIQKYIFPGGVLPSLEEMRRVNANTGLELVSSDDIGLSYAKTLHLWRDTFWEQLDAVKAQGKDDYFVRTWDYYLASCEAGFLTRITGDVQVVFEKTV